MTSPEFSHLDRGYKAALATVVSRLDEALAALEAPAAEWCTAQLELYSAAYASKTLMDPAIGAFAVAYDKHEQLESLISTLRTARRRCEKWGR